MMGSRLAGKKLTAIELSDNDKHTSLQQYNVNYRRKSFIVYSQDSKLCLPRAYYFKTFYGCNYIPNVESLTFSVPSSLVLYFQAIHEPSLERFHSKGRLQALPQISDLGRSD
jgi:hypothetical protein